MGRWDPRTRAEYITITITYQTTELTSTSKTQFTITVVPESTDRIGLSPQ